MGKFDIRNIDPQLDYEQFKAIRTVLWEDYGRIPFLISGPPGTGKTNTLIELALQLLKHEPSPHLLVCAPSEPTSNTLVQRLSAYLKPADVLRLTAPSRSFNEVLDSIKSYCCVDQDTFSLPSSAQLMALKTVVTTFQDAELLLRACVSNHDLAHLEQSLSAAIHPAGPPTPPKLHWTALLIEEAAQATEPETIIPLSVLSPDPSANLPIFIMVGDQHQLSSRTASRTPSLSTPLFARLFTRPFYRDHPLSRHASKHGHNPRLTNSMLSLPRPPYANLIRNYRSHPSILAVSSLLFYNNTTLESEAHSTTTSLLPWSGWRDARWPVLFAPNSSPDELERDAGGWYNAPEAHKALAHARSLSHASFL